MAVDNIGLPEIDPGMNKKYSPDIDPPEKAKGDKADPIKTSKRDQEKLLATARKRFKACVESEADNRKKALEDLKFKAGEQWPADIRQQRSNEKRPCLTINTIPTLTHQVSNDLRQNRPAINVSPVGNKSDKQGAQAFAGMIKSIERDCAADIAYDTAITSAVDIGFGYWRILTEYESEKSFNQVLVIRRVRNPFSVYLDPMRQEPDGSDSTFGFVTEMLPREEYKAKYPKANKLGWTEKGVGDELSQWIERDAVRIAEYFTIDHDMRRLVQLATGHVGFYDDLDDSIKADIEAGRMEILNEREAEVQSVTWYKITGLEILETRRWPGRWIPIVEVVGEEIDLQGKVIRNGMIRNAKDPARMKNYWASSKTEMVALAPKAPWIGAEGQFEGHPEWDQAHVKTYSKLEYRPLDLEGHPVPPPSRQPMVGVPQGIVEAEQSSAQDMMAATGVRFNATAQDRLYDESGKALREIRRNTDIGAFHYMDNASRSLRHSGRILIDLIPKVYDSQRVVTILREDDTQESITIDPNQGAATKTNPRAAAPAAKLVFNPSVGEYGVTVTTGPSYATRRIEAHEQMMDFARILPEKGSLIAHLIAKYSDWPGSDEVYKLLMKALPPNLLAPSPKDMPPQVGAFVSGLMQQMAKLMAERKQMLKDLTDMSADRQVKMHKIDTDFEAKIAKIFTDAKGKMLELSQADMHHAADMASDLMASAQIPMPGAMPGQIPGFDPGTGQVPQLLVSPVPQPNFG